MASLTSVKNQFLGINPPLHSHLQARGGWDNFHVNHISDLTRFLQRDLRELGYVAQAEQSLQIRRRDEPGRAPESDVTVYDLARRPGATKSGLGEQTLSVPELLEISDEELATYRAVGIYQKAGDDSRGDAVAWLELLSPTNKPSGRHFSTYRDKRTALLQAGLVFIELDYLHHSAPTFAAPLYPDYPESSAYRILIIDPRPDWLNGTGWVYPVQVDESLPTLDVPLNAEDVVRFDFDEAYQATYEALYFGDSVDYGALPPAWDRYSDADKAQILTRLLMLRDDPSLLDQPPQPIKALSLVEAERRWLP